MRLKLNRLKTNLAEAEKLSCMVESKITMANDQADKSVSEIKFIQKSLVKIKKQNKNIQQYINAYSVPEVIEYAKFIENLQPLERQIKHFSRKIDVKNADHTKNKALLNL
ncbi:hypothetical protein HELRODRAFT_172320 [Helobdella robusta]|uniref:Uncharacterized protein n=1 Tax=Helobdella robusta TaxID=6412 RepID=T1F572_HELRO|nr:hypothetical protein HELRODRAFT_172320 [Helobdella robusta]ESO04655.1 hypothetical protein HELRODRAFT_172320 [Helobdella robusta]